MEVSSSVVSIQDLGAGIFSFRIARPAGFDFQAGQYMLLRLDEKLVKPFTISSAPTEKSHIEFTTKMSESDYKKKLAKLKTEDTITLTGPMGKFTYSPPYGKAVFLAGGIGITPFASILKYLADTKASFDCILLWGVNTMDDAVFKSDFEAITASNSGFKAVYVPSKPPAGWVGRSGFITGELIAAEVPDLHQRTFYLCGPPKMVEAMGKLLSGLGIAKEKIVIEQFGGY